MAALVGEREWRPGLGRRWSAGQGCGEAVPLALGGQAPAVQADGALWLCGAPRAEKGSEAAPHRAVGTEQELRVCRCGASAVPVQNAA